MLKQYKLRNYHFQLIAYLVILTIIGIMVIGSAEKSVQSKQILGFVAGLVIMIFISVIDYSVILKFRWILYLILMVFLIWVEIDGKTVGGAQRWIDLKVFTFQPSELAKIILILFFAGYFMRFEEKINDIRVIGGAFLIAAPPLFMILSQPDTSTTIIIILIFIVLLFIAGLSYKIVMGVLSVCLPVGIVGLTYIIQNADELIEKKFYQVKRIMSWIDPIHYSDTASQQQNSIMAIGSGQLWGKGLNNSEATSMKNSNFIIEPQTDFIFAVVGEELGFVGCFAVIILLALIVIECLMIARKAKDLSGKLICCGMAALISFQSFVNICVATGLMPNTGIPLPFVSYGLTSIMSLYIGMGFVLNIGLQPKKYFKGDFL